MFFSSDSLHTVIPDNTDKSESGGDWILHHIMDGNYLDFEPFGKIYLPHLEIFGFDISITRHVVFLWVVAFLLIITFLAVSKSYKKSIIPHGFTNFIETIILFVRDEIVKPTIGHGYKRFLPYLLTAFFFILSWINSFHCNCDKQHCSNSNLGSIYIYFNSNWWDCSSWFFRILQRFNTTRNACCTFAAYCSCRNFWFIH